MTCFSLEFLRQSTDALCRDFSSVRSYSVIFCMCPGLFLEVTSLLPFARGDLNSPPSLCISIVRCIFMYLSCCHSFSYPGSIGAALCFKWMDYKAFVKLPVYPLCVYIYQIVSPQRSRAKLLTHIHGSKFSAVSRSGLFS